ncbi:amidase domain-containing protein [Lysinibacillus sp. NPDC093692]|uniref:amidase domain-containing protein n=1 Tax=Lysinibacillus sp. NPDC093692 TaxID=3390578 RepID=UPI003D06912C
MAKMYNRQAAVQYANLWWNRRNPAFPNFTVDCTNYISQCLLAGGAPMRGAPNRGKGWWLQHGNWSFSWSVAHSLRWYLEGSTTGLKGRRVQSAEELELGDIIFYDFQGDGRVDHSVIVTSIQNGIPYVNAHTSDSINRSYFYEDSTAYTPSMTYYYIHIDDSFA